MLDRNLATKEKPLLNLLKINHMNQNQTEQKKIIKQLFMI